MSIVLRYLGLSTACALIAVTPLFAQTSDEMKMLGVSIKSLSGTYLVLKDVNVRAKPATRSKRIGRFKSGERVEAIGRVKGPWLAVRGDGNVSGFVFEPILMPVIDGAIAKPLKGQVALGDGACHYVIEFLGRTKAERQLFKFADFEVGWLCQRESKKIIFDTPMFITEGPYQGRQKPVHQITVDILELEGGLEEVFSTHLLWDRSKGEISFDSVNIKKFAHAQPPKAKAASNVSQALRIALELVTSAWASGVWQALAKKSENR